MSTKFFALLTQLGADKLANAAALGTKIEITHMAVGDGGGKLPTPDTKQTKLINEKRRAAINTLSIDPKNTNQIIAEQVIPENEGGWWIREIGLFDKDGILIAVGNCAETYKPQLQEGSGRTQTIRMILIVSSADAVTLKVDPSVILATREYVDDSIQKHANSRNHPDATLKEKGFVILSSAVDSNSETHAATPKAVKAAYDFANAANNNANGRLEKNKNGADVADKDAFNHNIGSGRAFSGEVTIGGGGTWTTEEFIAWLKSKGAFNHPYWMCKGTWAYASNRRITDTGCGSIHLAGAVVEVMGIESVMTIRVTTAPTSVDGCIPNAQFTYGNHGKDYLPSWRRDYNTINKPTSGEVGAYSKSETDERVNARLEKSKNGADIPNKDEFVKNLGLVEIMEQAQNALPKSSIVQVTGGSAEQVMSQKAVTDALVNAVSIDMLYPVGIVVWFAQNKNPNVLFPKTQWQYIGENKTVRLATANGLDVLTAGGSDSITLTTPQIPAHNHSFSGSTSSFDYGSKTTNYAGEHFHDSGWGDQDASRYGYYDGTNSNYGSGRSDWDNRKFNTSTDGSHTHSIYIGAHTHTVSGNTENTGSGSPVSIVNMYIKLMGWYRTA